MATRFFRGTTYELILGTDGDDPDLAGEGSDPNLPKYIDGLAGSDYLIGTFGDEVLDGGPGVDFMEEMAATTSISSTTKTT